MTLMHWGILGLAYLVGSIPFGVLVARSRGVDIMKVGSGNVGATNVYRTLGKGPGLTVFLLDVLKGAFPSAYAAYLFHDKPFGFAAGIAAVVGHAFSPWLKFRGGKGIATGLGALFGNTPIVALITFGTFLLVLVTTRYVSIASLVASFAIIPYGIAFGEPWPVLLGFTGLAIFVLVKHRPNIERLRAGTELKFSFGGPKKEEAPPAGEPAETPPERNGEGD